MLSGSLSAQAQKDLSVLMDKIEGISGNLEDGFDSLKAGQMELARLSKPNTYHAAEIEEDSGESLWERIVREVDSRRPTILKER